MILPSYKTLNEATHHIELQLSIAPDLIYLEGHFPDYPILPGVVQTHWAIGFAQKIWSANVTFSQLKQLKFKDMILPNSEIGLRLMINNEKSQLRFEYFAIDDSRTLSSGIIESVSLPL